MYDYHLLIEGDPARANRWIPFAVGQLHGLHRARFASRGASLTRTLIPEQGVTIRVDSTAAKNTIWIRATGTPWFICYYRASGSGNAAEYDIFLYSPEREEMRKAFRLDVSDYSWLTSGDPFVAPNRVTYHKKVIDFEAFDTSVSYNLAQGRFEAAESPPPYYSVFPTTDGPTDNEFIVPGFVSAAHEADHNNGSHYETGVSLRLYPTVSAREGVICSAHYRDNPAEGTVGLEAFMDDWEGNYYYVGRRFTGEDEDGTPVSEKTLFELDAWLNDPAKLPSGNWGYFAGLRPVPMMTAERIYYTLANNDGVGSGEIDVALFDYNRGTDTVTKHADFTFVDDSTTKSAATVEQITVFLEGLDKATIGYATSVMEIGTGSPGDEPVYNDAIRLYAGPEDDLLDAEGNVVRAGGITNVSLVAEYDLRPLFANGDPRIEKFHDNTTVPEMVVENFWVVKGGWSVDEEGNAVDNTTYGVHLIHQHPLDSEFAGMLARYTVADGLEVLYYTGARAEGGRDRDIVNAAFYDRWAVFREEHATEGNRDLKLDMLGSTWDFDNDTNASLGDVRDSTFYDADGSKIEAYSSAGTVSPFLPAFTGEFSEA